MAAAIFWLGVGACAARERDGAVGSSMSGAASAGSARGAGSAAPFVSPVPDDFRFSLVKVNRARFVANGHAGGKYEADVYVDAEGKSAYASARAAVPVGTRLAMDHVERAGGKQGPIMMMEKREAGFDATHGDWRYVVVDGTSIADGALAACARCHDEAPHDHIFRAGD